MIDFPAAGENVTRIIVAVTITAFLSFSFGWLAGVLAVFYDLDRHGITYNNNEFVNKPERKP